MKVFNTSHCFRTDEKGYNRQAHVIVAAKTKKRAAELLGMSMYTFNNYVSETGNKADIEEALANPETVIVKEFY